MYSNVATKMEVFLTSLNEWSPQRSAFIMLELFLRKILSSVLRSLLKRFSLSFEKLGQ